MECMSTFDEFTSNIITKFYLNESEIKVNEPIRYSTTNDNLNIQKTEFGNTYNIIETEDTFCFDSLEKLDIDNSSEIYFETRPNYTYTNYQNNLNYCSLRNSMILLSQLKQEEKRILAFKTSCSDFQYYIEVNENEEFEVVLLRLRTKFPQIFNQRKINAALVGGKNLMTEECRKSRIKNLDIKDSAVIVIILGQ